jgi:hypothetical protein
MTLLHVSQAGPFSLSIEEDPLALVRRRLDRGDGSCDAAVRRR